MQTSFKKMQRSGKKERRSHRSVERQSKAKECPGCPVPAPNVCLIGSKVDEKNPPVDAIKIQCKNDQCDVGKYLHAQCYTVWEKKLVKILSMTSWARSWTESQRRANLWGTKGFLLISKACKCRCGAGQIRVVKNMLELSNSAEAIGNVGLRGKKKRQKTLPALNQADYKCFINRQLPNAGSSTPKAERQSRRRDSTIIYGDDDEDEWTSLIRYTSIDRRAGRKPVRNSSVNMDMGGFSSVSFVRPPSQLSTPPLLPTPPPSHNGTPTFPPRSNVWTYSESSSPAPNLSAASHGTYAEVAAGCVPTEMTPSAGEADNMKVEFLEQSAMDCLNQLETAEEFFRAVKCLLQECSEIDGAVPIDSACMHRLFDRCAPVLQSQINACKGLHGVFTQQLAMKQGLVVTADGLVRLSQVSTSVSTISDVTQSLSEMTMTLDGAVTMDDPFHQDQSHTDNKRIRATGRIQNVFPRYGYISSPSLDTNVFFVPSHIQQMQVVPEHDAHQQRKLSRRESTPGSPASSLDVIWNLTQALQVGDVVEFEAEPQSERSGCKWLATKVQPLGTVARSHLTPLSQQITTPAHSFSLLPSAVNADPMYRESEVGAGACRSPTSAIGQERTTSTVDSQPALITHALLDTPPPTPSPEPHKSDECVDDGAAFLALSASDPPVSGFSVQQTGSCQLSQVVPMFSHLFSSCAPLQVAQDSRNYPLALEGDNSSQSVLLPESGDSSADEYGLFMGGKSFGLAETVIMSKYRCLHWRYAEYNCLQSLPGFPRLFAADSGRI